MKKSSTLVLSLLAMTLGFSVSAFADDYLCNFADSSQMLRLTKLQDLPVDENNEEGVELRSRYNLQVETPGIATPSIDVEGIVEQFDVHFNFTSDDKNIAYQMYLDENEATLYIGRDERLIRVCRIL